MNICKICANSENNQIYTAKEMMFGLREEFGYSECAKCGALQINEIPTDLAKYYGEGYYAYDKIDENNIIKNFLKTQLAKHCYNGKGILGKLLVKKFGRPLEGEWFKNSGINHQSKILDIGCGAGHLLMNLKLLGFSNLTGADPYIEKDIIYSNGVKIFKKDIFQLSDKYDFIMLHHAFEHMADPLAQLKQMNQLLNPGGKILIRIPVAGSFAWKKYGVNWVQLDAPRHMFLHTEASMKILTDQSGFQVSKVIYDSTEFQFWGSEQYLQDIPLQDPRSYLVNPKNSIFTADQIASFKSQALELNQNGEGDAACFYLSKK